MKTSYPLLTLFCALLINACEPPPVTSFEVVAHASSDPVDMHPVNTRSAAALQILELLYERPMEISKFNHLPEPNLISLVSKSEDGLEYVYALHQAAKWPDGKGVTPADIIFSYKVMTCPLVNNYNQKTYLESLAAVEPVEGNPRAVRFRMRIPYQLNDYVPTLGFLLDPRHFDPGNVLAAYAVSDFLADPDRVSKDEALVVWASAFNDPANGTEVDWIAGGNGPYRLASWIPGQEVVLERQRYYWKNDVPGSGALAGPTVIRFKVIKDDKALELALLSGEVDVATSISSETYQSLAANDSAKALLSLSVQARSTVAYLALNNRPVAVGRPRLFDDPMVRNAIALAIPIDSIIAQFLYGMAVRANSPVPPHHPDYNSELKNRPYAPEEARALLRAAGWEDKDMDGVLEKTIGGKRTPFRFVLLYPIGSAQIEKLALRIRENLKLIGIDCQPEPVKSMVDRLRNHEFDAALTALGSNNLPYEYKQNWHSANWPNGDNFVGYANPRVDSLIDRSRMELDSLKREALTDEIQRLMYEDCPVVFFYTPQEKIAYTRRLPGVTVYPFKPYIYLNELRAGSPAR